jgi:hypothetical protein
MQRVNSAHVMTHFVSLKKQTLHDVAKIIKFEKSPIFTQNLPYLDSAREKWLSCYQQARRNPDMFLKPPASQSRGRNWHRVQFRVAMCDILIC